MLTGTLRSDMKNHRAHTRGIERRRVRRLRAEARNLKWSELSDVEQAKQLDRRHGVGKGATRQRKRLMAGGLFMA